MTFSSTAARLTTPGRGVRDRRSAAPIVDQRYYRLFSPRWWTVALAIFALIFVSGGTLSVIVYLGCALNIVWRHPVQSVRTLATYAFLLSLPALALLSTLWSDAPNETMKQSLELLISIAAAIIISRRIAPRDIAPALMIAAAVICAVSLVRQPSALHGSPLYGVLGSKNQMAFTAQLLIASATATLVDRRQPLLLRLFSAGAFLLGLLDLWLARSGGAYVTTVLSLAAFFGLASFTLMPMQGRLLVLALMLLAMAPVVVDFHAVTQLATTIQTKVLHKDATLTGRTEIWSFATTLMREKPIWGHGASAFWREGNLDAEALWRTFGIANRSGFNFHNQFIDTRVDLGWVGIGVLVTLLAIIGVASLARAVRHPSIPAAFMASVMIALYSRLPVESTLVLSWNIYTFLWMAIAVHGFAPLASSAVAVQPSSRPLAKAKAWIGARSPAFRTGNTGPVR